MNRSPRRFRSARSGFTLVELLVVIGIIAILASVVLAGATAALNAAKRAKAQNTANQIQTAITNYYTEYSVYPVAPNGNGDAYYNNKDVNDWVTLTQVLCGNINPYQTTQAVVNPDGLNSRNIPFLTPARSDLGDAAHAFLRNPFTPAANPEAYFLCVDSDYSGLAGDSGTGKGQLPDFVASSGKKAITYLTGGVTQGVAVWSNTSDYNVTGTQHPQFWSRTY